jgi:hypothetical protein
LNGTWEEAVTAVPTTSARIFIVVIIIKKTKARTILFSWDAKYSDNTVKAMAIKKEQTPTSIMYLPDTVDLSLLNTPPRNCHSERSEESDLFMSHNPYDEDCL